MGKARMNLVVVVRSLDTATREEILILFEEFLTAHGKADLVIQLDNPAETDVGPSAGSVLFRSAWTYLEAQGACDGWGGAECLRIWDAWKRDGQRVAQDFIRRHAAMRSDGSLPK